jgi:hypothetical protein
MFNTSVFNEAEVATLRTHGIVIYANRVIFNAQPPISSTTLAWVQERCAGPIPEQLLRFWSITAGGSIDYDANLEIEGASHGFSWTELFFEGADTYFDLPGWVTRELEGLQESCEESGRAFSGLLSWLPIGGFEYLDRVYVCVAPGEQYGSVAFWMRGLPAAWTHRLHENSMATVAATLNDAFAKLYLESHPDDDSDPYKHGNELFEYLDERINGHGLSQSLAERLIDFYATAVVDWRNMLDAGTVLQSQGARKGALNEAVRTDDAAIITRLAALGDRFEDPVAGSALAIDLAIGHGANGVLRELLRCGAKVPVGALDGMRAEMPVDLIEQLLTRGAQATFDIAAQAVACGSAAGARLIAAASPGMKLRRTSNMNKAIVAARISLQDKLRAVQAGDLSHYLGVDGLQLRIDRLDSFTLQGD